MILIIKSRTVDQFQQKQQKGVKKYKQWVDDIYA